MSSKRTPRRSIRRRVRRYKHPTVDARAEDAAVPSLVGTAVCDNEGEALKEELARAQCDTPSLYLEPLPSVLERMALMRESHPTWHSNTPLFVHHVLLASAQTDPVLQPEQTNTTLHNNNNDNNNTTTPSYYSDQPHPHPPQHPAAALPLEASEAAWEALALPLMTALDHWRTGVLKRTLYTLRTARCKRVRHEHARLGLYLRLWQLRVRASLARRNTLRLESLRGHWDGWREVQHNLRERRAVAPALYLRRLQARLFRQFRVHTTLARHSRHAQLQARHHRLKRSFRALHIAALERRRVDSLCDRLVEFHVQAHASLQRKYFRRMRVELAQRRFERHACVARQRRRVQGAFSRWRAALVCTRRDRVIQARLDAFTSNRSTARMACVFVQWRRWQRSMRSRRETSRQVCQFQLQCVWRRWTLRQKRRITHREAVHARRVTRQRIQVARKKASQRKLWCVWRSQFAKCRQQAGFAVMACEQRLVVKAWEALRAAVRAAGVTKRREAAMEVTAAVSVVASDAVHDVDAVSMAGVEESEGVQADGAVVVRIPAPCTSRGEEEVDTDTDRGEATEKSTPELDQFEGVPITVTTPLSQQAFVTPQRAVGVVPLRRTVSRQRQQQQQQEARPKPMRHQIVPASASLAKHKRTPLLPRQHNNNSATRSTTATPARAANPPSHQLQKQLFRPATAGSKRSPLAPAPSSSRHRKSQQHRKSDHKHSSSSSKLFSTKRVPVHAKQSSPSAAVVGISGGVPGEKSFLDRVEHVSSFQALLASGFLNT